jgi:hypothetical protein
MNRTEFGEPRGVCGVLNSFEQTGTEQSLVSHGVGMDCRNVLVVDIWDG